MKAIWQAIVNMFKRLFGKAQAKVDAVEAQAVAKVDDVAKVDAPKAP